MTTSITTIKNQLTPLNNKNEIALLLPEKNASAPNNCTSISIMSLPVILSYLIEFLNPFITNYSVGWLGKSELASSALSTMFANMTGFAFALGMTSCLETLCSQAYTGSRDIKLVGLFAQRGFFVSLVLFLPISAIWLKAEELLLLIGQEEELSRLCGVYLKWLLLAVPPFIGFECIKKYLQAQNIMNASAYILILSLPICVLCNYILVWHPALSIGFIGAPISLVISTWSSFLFSICYVLFIDGKQAWGGFTINAFKEWNIIIKLGIPGVIMLCSEWWTYEILAFCASYINTTSLAAHGSLGNLGTLFFQISIGTSAVASILIGNTLGLGDAKKAKKTSMNCIIVGSIHGLITCLFILLTSNYLKQFNNNDPQFVKILQNVLPVLALFQFTDTIGGVCGGLFRGMGRQEFGAKLNLFSFLFISTPFSILLAFYFELQLVGLWLGLVIGSIFISIISVLLLTNIDWYKEVELSKLRIN